MTSPVTFATVAFVGAGPTAIYTLHALVSRARRPFALTIFEEQPSAGRGTPYRPGWNDPAMLSNIASIEIPPLEQSLADWLRAQPAERLAARGIDPNAIGERTFYPRLVLGDFFQDQFLAILARAKREGKIIEVRTRSRVIDASSAPDGMTLTVRPVRGAVYRERFDHVVLATGHQWPSNPEVRPGYFSSPWPASALGKIAPCHVGVRGTSLTAIDAAVALAVAHGAFVEEGDGVSYQPAPNAGDFRITMMSRKGILPEADFFFPIPYEPLSVCTPEAVDRLIAAPEDGMLDRAFALFKDELIAADPAYAQKLGLADLTLEQFHDAYFAPRLSADSFAWAEQNLREADHNYTAKFTVPWRYAILRLHEAAELLVPYFEEADYERFSRYLKPVFVDDYATVPHTSIKRMLALHRAGKLDVLALGDDYKIDSHRAEGGAAMQVDGAWHAFPVFIDATGQKALGAKSFPFPSLLSEGIIHDAQTSDGGSMQGIAIDDQFHPVSPKLPADQLFCLSLPFILGRHPFHQGITSSHEMGVVVAEQLALAMERSETPHLAAAV